MVLEETSAGAVIFRKTENGNSYLLLHYPSGHWDFVKGKMESGETPRETAIREAKEETGISDLLFMDGFEETIEYNFQHEGTPIHKKVLFYLAESKTEDITISHEHQDFVWLKFNEAIQKTTYQNAKTILTKANELISRLH